MKHCAIHAPTAQERINPHPHSCTCTPEELERHMRPSIIGRIYFWLIIIVMVSFVLGAVGDALSG